ncbi:hypothetical protein PR048_021543 [Dryococelus australis]|uniref:Uncharacterized protein n=1 Tax=Dryococelus australis TaxID=614101 RepID=A0ABQ9GYI8_9NEOP|nr:hypothetical protein PR048_021543 [Dryococelus australis]
MNIGILPGRTEEIVYMMDKRNTYVLGMNGDEIGIQVVLYGQLQRKEKWKGFVVKEGISDCLIHLSLNCKGQVVELQVYAPQLRCSTEEEEFEKQLESRMGKKEADAIGEFECPGRKR